MAQAPGVAGIMATWGAQHTTHRQRGIVDQRVIRVETGWDGEEGWERRGENLATLTGGRLESAARNALFLLLLAFRQAGVPVTLEGRETVGESEAWVLAVEPSGGERERHFIDTPASLPGGLSTVPRVVYKENDGIFGTGPTVTWPLPLPTSSRCSGNPVSDPWVGLPLG